MSELCHKYGPNWPKVLEQHTLDLIRTEIGRRRRRAAREELRGSLEVTRGARNQGWALWPSVLSPVR